MSVCIVCEIGSNHDGDIKKARQMINSAKNCGADSVKFQIFKADTMYSKNTRDFDKYINVYQMIKNLEVPLSFFSECNKICLDNNIEFMATPFDEDSVDFLFNLGVKRLKIASFEFSDARLVKYISETGLPIVASTGLASMNDVRDFLDISCASDITLLHCNSAYPTPDKDVHLRAMELLKMFGTKVGYSDHSEGILAPVLSVSMGACFIEKHFTLDRTSDGPDHAFAVEVEQFTKMVNLIRQSEIMLGQINFDRSESELNMAYAKRGIVANKFILKGKVIEKEDITTIRPENGISASRYFNVIGKVACCDIEEKEAITDASIKS